MYIDHKQVSRKWILRFILIIWFLPACVLFPEVERWHRADEVKGTWETEVTVYEAVPAGQKVMYKSDCDNRDDCLVQLDTCVSKIVDDYVFDRTINEQIGRDLWDPRTSPSESYTQDNGSSRSVIQVYIERDACVETNQPAGGGYNYWDCPVWAEEDIYRLVQQEKLSCTVDLVTYRPLEVYPLRGTGTEIEWQDPFVPPRGKKVRRFSGHVTVISNAGNIQYEFDEFRKPELYLKHFAEPQYIGVGLEGDAAIAGSKEELWIMYGDIGVE